MRRTRSYAWLLAQVLILAACTTAMPATDAGSDAAADDANTVDAARVHTDAGPHFDLGTTARPAPVILPAAYDGTTPLPLIILLHGDGVTAAVQDVYLHLSAVTRTSGALLALPIGTMHTGSSGMPFLAWNDGITQSTSADDVMYLGSVIDQALAMLPVDRSRIYFIGHSNGGFMAYRMACAEAARIAGIASINAGDYPTSTGCQPVRPVSVLDLHGTADTVVSYDGAIGVFSGALQSTERWAMRASCDVSMTHSPAPFEMDNAVPGPETTATDYIVGCGRARVSRFTMAGSMHIPGFTMASTQQIVDWLLAQSSPP